MFIRKKTKHLSYCYFTFTSIEFHIFHLYRSKFFNPNFALGKSIKYKKGKNNNYNVFDIDIEKLKKHFSIINGNSCLVNIK
jgi:hypothetical protein